MKTDLRLSIVIPAYNAAAWLERATQHVEAAVKRAGIKHAEIVIVNDGSSDDTLKVARALSRDGRHASFVA
jgi:glycosyltransferase involved in cell wall biosynthesis